MKYLGLVAAGLILGCRSPEGPSGRLELAWTGADTGRIELPAAGHWCASEQVLEIVAVEGDSGAAVALFPAQALVPGVYPALPPVTPRRRPSAGIAVRRYGQTLIEGFYSLSGVVRLDSTGRAGSLEGTLQSHTNGDQVQVTGRFRNLPIDSAATCAGSASAGADSGLR